MLTIRFGDFEWDEEKAEQHVLKHAVSFEEAASVFLDLDYLLVTDAADPERFIALGVFRPWPACLWLSTASNETS